MDVLNADLKQTVEANSQNYNLLISQQQHNIIMTVNNVFLSSFVSSFGIVTNVINLVVFYKQGLDSSINIALFALAFSDLFSVLMQLCLNIYMNPWFRQTDWLIEPFEFHFLVAGLPRVGFNRNSCMITVCITMERCLCIMFPLHINRMITARRTAVAMLTIHLFTLVCATPIICTSSVGWKFYPETNKTLLGLILSPTYDSTSKTAYITISCLGFALFLAVIILTAILISQLTRKSKWRLSAKGDKSESMSNRDKEVGSMVVLIAVLLIVSNLPTCLLSAATCVEPELRLGGRLRNLYYATWSVAFLFETTNSSVNIFLYMKMSSKYRKTFHALFTRKHK